MDASAALMLKFAARIDAEQGVSQRRKRRKRCFLYYYLRAFALVVMTHHFKPNDKILGQEEAVLHRLLAAGFSRREIDLLYTTFLRMDLGQ